MRPPGGSGASGGAKAGSGNGASGGADNRAFDGSNGDAADRGTIDAAALSGGDSGFFRRFFHPGSLCFCSGFCRRGKSRNPGVAAGTAASAQDRPAGADKPAAKDAAAAKASGAKKTPARPDGLPRTGTTAGGVEFEIERARGDVDEVIDPEQLNLF